MFMFNIHDSFVHINPFVQRADVVLPGDFECRPDVLMVLRGHSSSY